MIGQSLPLQGAAFFSASRVLQATQAYVGHINSTGGVNGRKLELVTLDDENDPARLEANIRSLAEKHNRAVALVNCLGDVLCERASLLADNVLDRQFQADGPNQKWVADFTYLRTAEGWLYVAAVLDLYSRRAVGWSMRASMTSQLVADELMMAVWRRGRPVELLHHSDQGSQYTSEHFQKLLEEQGITCSMSRVGEVWDNSAMESFFSSLKTERTVRKVYRSREQARADVWAVAGFTDTLLRWMMKPAAAQQKVIRANSRLSSKQNATLH